MSNSIGQIALDLVVNPSKFKSQMNGITKTAKASTSQLTGMFKKVGFAVAAAFSVRAIVNFSKECLRLGSDLAEVQNVVDVTFGSMSGAVDNWAKNAMTSFGMSEKVAKEYVGQLGAMSKAFGNSTQEAYNQATSLAGLVGDVASFYNLTTDEAFTKLKAVYTGETESLKSLGVVMTQAALDEYALAKGYGKTTNAMSEQEKVALRLAFVTDRLSGASGDFVRTADGWANQTRVLKLRFDALKASIGQGLINALLPLVRVLNTILERLQVVADAFSNFMTNLFGDAGPASSAVSAAAAGTEAISSNLDDAESSAKAIKKALAGFDQINLISNKAGSSNAGIGTGGSTSGDAGSVESNVSKGAAAAGKLKGFLEEVKNKLIEITKITGLKGLWDDFLIAVGNVKKAALNLFDSFTGAVNNCKSQLESLASSLKRTFTTMLQTITKIFGDIWVSISEGLVEFTEENQAEIKKAFENIITIISNALKLISDIIGDLYKSLGDWWDKDGKRIFDEIISVAKDIGKWILKIWNSWISPVVINLQNALRSLWDQHLKPLWDEILAMVTAIWDCVKALWDKLKPFIDWIINILGPVLTPIINGLVNVISNSIGTVIDWVKSLLTVLRGLLTFVTGVLSGDWAKAWSGIKTSFGGVADGIKTIINGVKNTFKTSFDNIKNTAIGAWTGIKSAFSGMGSWFKEKLAGVNSSFSSVWSNVKSGAKGAWSGIKDTFSTVKTWFKDKFTDAWTAVKNVFSTGGKIFDGIKDGIVSSFKTVVNGIITGINKVVKTPFEGLNKVLDKIQGIKIAGAKPFSFLSWRASVPQIPKLATGGYVAANTPQLAIIGDNKREGEIVAPESKITEAVTAAFRQFLPLFNNGGNNKPIYLTLKLGDGTFWEGFVDYHNDIVKRTGDTPLLI